MRKQEKEQNRISKWKNHICKPYGYECVMLIYLYIVLIFFRIKVIKPGVHNSFCFSIFGSRILSVDHSTSDNCSSVLWKLIILTKITVNLQWITSMIRLLTVVFKIWFYSQCSRPYKYNSICYLSEYFINL